MSADPHRLLAQTKNYIKVDGTYEDDLIGALILAGEAYLETAGVAEPIIETPPTKKNKLYDLAVMMFASDNYNNRIQIAFDTQQSVKVDYGLKQIILMLKDFSLEEGEDPDA